MPIPVTLLPPEAAEYFREKHSGSVGQTYYAKRLPNGNYEFDDIPIFAETRRWNESGQRVDVYDKDWLEDASREANEHVDRGWALPIHLHHTDEDGKSKRRQVGRLKNFEVKKGEVEGGERHMVFATLTEIPPDVLEEMKSTRFGDRSMECKPSERRFTSMALLDGEPPFFKLPTIRAAVSDEKSAFGELALFVECEGGVEIVVFRGKAITFSEDKMPKDNPNEETSADDPIVDDSDEQDDEFDDEITDLDDIDDDIDDEAGDDLDGGSSVDAIRNIVKESVREILMEMAPQLASSAAPPQPVPEPAPMAPAPAQQLPPAPPAPVAASEPSSGAQSFQDAEKTMDAQTAAKFAEMEAELASVRKERKQDQRKQVIKEGVADLHSYREERDGASGKIRVRIDPQSIPFHEKNAERVKAEDLPAYFSEVKKVARFVVDEIIDNESDQPTPQMASDPRKVAEQFAEKSEPLKAKLNGPEGEAYAKAISTFSDTWDRLPEGRRQNYKDKQHFVESCVRRAETSV